MRGLQECQADIVEEVVLERDLKGGKSDSGPAVGTESGTGKGSGGGATPQRVINEERSCICPMKGNL